MLTRKCLSIVDKLDILNEIDRGVTKKIFPNDTVF